MQIYIKKTTRLINLHFFTEKNSLSTTLFFISIQNATPYYIA